MYLKTPHPLSNHFDILVLYKVAKTIVQGIMDFV